MKYALIALFVFLLPGLLLYAAQVFSMGNKRPFELLSEIYGVPMDRRNEAMVCFTQAKQKAEKIVWYDVTAPYVMLFVLPFVSRDANALPKLFRMWDNERSLNGDGWGKLVDGVWKTFRTTNEPNCIPYTHPDFQGVAYYVEFLAGLFPASWLTPRSFIARYVWLGLRNRASNASFLNGIVITEALRQDVESWGDVNTGKKNADSSVVQGTVLYRAGPYYEIYSVEKRGSWLERTRFGYKLTNALDPRMDMPRAMVTAMGISYKRA